MFREKLFTEMSHLTGEGKLDIDVMVLGRRVPYRSSSALQDNKIVNIW